MGRTKKKQTREEKLEKKRLAERRRLQKIKNDPALYEEFKIKDRARYYKKKEQKKVVPISEMTPRRQRTQRKRNRDNFKAYYSRQKNKKRLDTLLSENSPPESGDELPPQPIVENSTVATNSCPPSPLSLSRCSRSQTRSNRVQNTYHDQLIISSPCPSDSCNVSVVSKSTFRRYQYKKTKIIQSLQKKIVELQRQQKSFRKQVQRLQVKKIVTNYKETEGSKNRTKELKSKHASKIHTLKLSVQRFLSDDENSRLCPGKKDYISKNMIKHQKRYLSDSLQNLHQKYVKEYHNVHYGTFCKLRPYWILVPSVNVRDTCVCKLHENMALLIKSLKANKIIFESNPTELVQNLTCDRNRTNCLQRNCDHCRHRVINYKEFDNTQKITYSSWETSNQSYTKQGIEKKGYITEKIKITNSPLNIIKKLECDLKPFMNHCANIVNQSLALRNTKDNLKTYECVLHIDFSENYNTKFGTEIQSMHFGGNRKQLTLHTAVLYYYNQTTGSKETKSICTLNHVDGLLYTWPNHGDIDIITTSSIKRVLKEPTIKNDGEILFQALT
ncbi:unnamed protein product [Arctia plantaginis]|uniref:Uncharacterized protein n=1 Tax=Arctia plantaginis TaxID=874455 RepID=A0A8S0ZNM1_ARCPL|nr:unnamed protein product [Arctia plantaginis]